ncbi:hypothetical protein BofuT4_P104790.1 [Botrytis cinerea T4]|uniref:Uncharacterized protein n=1 Tax=Botryotinia fuckeliana (strain T4) TaxID=999810 RepID=G2YA95_BOTF4|nr:hypothetical protein BofuT4_P104790.1 [Botrytis cinerea T4]
MIDMRQCNVNNRGTLLLHNHVAQDSGIMLSWFNSNADKHA